MFFLNKLEEANKSLEAKNLLNDMKGAAIRVFIGDLDWLIIELFKSVIFQKDKGFKTVNFEKCNFSEPLKLIYEKRMN